MNIASHVSTREETRGTRSAGLKGLRDRKKKQQSDGLLQAASELFRKNGFEATRMEDIASRANVSSNTVYNYFSTKERILFALQEAERARVIAVFDRVVANPPEQLTDAIALLIQAHLGEISSREDKKLWRELMAAKWRSKHHANEEFISARDFYVSYAEKLLKQFQKRRKVSRSLSTRVAGEIIYALSAHHFRQFCVNERITKADVLRMAKEQVEAIVSGWRS